MLGLGLGVDKIRPSGVLPLLDLYPATAAYSLRALSSTTTNVVKVREDGLNQEQDFTAKEITDGTLASFCGGNNGFVVTWYDQAGNNDATQVTAGNQPKIYDSSAGVVLENGKPAVDTLLRTGMVLSSTITTVASAFSVAAINTFNTVNYLYGFDGGSEGFFYGGTLTGINGIGMVVDGGIIGSLTGEDTNQHLASFTFDGASYSVSKDGGAASDFPSVNEFSVLQIAGRVLTPAIYFEGIVQEMIFYTTDQSANRTAIEDLINSHYNIYS